MYGKALIAVCDGELCQAIGTENGMTLIVREGGRFVRREMKGNKAGTAKTAGYGDGYFEFPFAVAEFWGGEIFVSAK